jgi:hypothetical protein
MRSILFATCFLLLAKVMMAAVPNSLSIEVDAKKLKYRVLLSLENESTEYDSFDLVAVAPGLASRGARVHVKDDSGQMIACANTERGYSSAELDSGSLVFKQSFKRPPQSGTVYSDWFDLADLVRGLDQCSKVPPDKWAKLMIVFSVRTRAKTSDSVRGQSTWLDLSPAVRRRLIGH